MLNSFQESKNLKTQVLRTGFITQLLLRQCYKESAILIVCLCICLALLSLTRMWGFSTFQDRERAIFMGKEVCTGTVFSYENTRVLSYSRYILAFRNNGCFLSKFSLVPMTRHSMLSRRAVTVQLCYMINPPTTLSGHSSLNSYNQWFNSIPPTLSCQHLILHSYFRVLFFCLCRCHLKFFFIK